MGMTNNNLCNSCINIGCEFQSGIVRTKCAFYMPPQLEPDNCGNYVVQKSTTKNDLGVDCISKEAVIDAFGKWCSDDKNFEHPVWFVRDIISMPSITPLEPRWIPVSERLPDKDGLYLVSVKNDHLRRYSKTCWYSDENWFARQDVVAWQPLPKPYKAESEDGK